MVPGISLLFAGLVFGLSGGLTPGPLLTLLLSQSLRYGAKEGVKIALAPLLTDLPIVVAAFFLVSRIADLELLLGVITLCGGCYLVYLGWESLRFKGIDPVAEEVNPRSFQKGVIVNFLNPNPYLFWFTVGAPSVLREEGSGPWPAILFFAGFYLTLVGAKVLLALLVGRTRGLLKSKHYLTAVRVLGLLLLFFALRFFWEGMQVFGLRG